MSTPNGMVSPTWDELGAVDGVPHNLTEEIMTAGPFNFPSLAVQDRTHGAGMPAPDTGMDDKSKYSREGT